MSAIQDYLTLCCREQWLDGLFRHMICEEDTLRLEAGHHIGAYCLPPIDSGETGFAWSRLLIDADLPQDSSLRVYAYASDTPDWSAWERLQDDFRADMDTVPEHFGPPLHSGCDFWLNCTGQYLWLALELTAAGAEQPLVHGVSLRMGGDHMLDYLPSIYQGDDFTYRFLSVFNSMMQDVEDEIEALPRQLAPESTDMLDGLAEWLCMDSSMENSRARIRSVLHEYETMYTPDGIQRSVRQLTGREPLLIEHFTVDPNREDCRNPTVYRRLYGDDPYRFFILLDEDTFASRDRMEWFLSHMRELIPAEMTFELVLLKHCIQLDWHTYLGVNTYIGNYIPAVIDETVTIHYDTTIGGA